MPTLTVELGPAVTTIAELIGLLTGGGEFNSNWFANAVSELESIPRRLPQLLDLIDDLLGPPLANSPAVFPGAQWYAIRNPANRQPTGFYVVTPTPSADITSGTIGVGVLGTVGYDALSIATYGFVPLFQLSTTASPQFVLTQQPAIAGVSASSTTGFSAQDGAAFSAMTLSVNIYLSDQLPSMQLVFENLTINGQAQPNSVSTYTTLSGLLANIDQVGPWIAAVLLQGTYWLSTYVGTSDYTIGDILTASCLLTQQTQSDNSVLYQLNTSYLQSNLNSPKVLAENFLFNLLNLLSNSATPLIPIPIGAEGSGIYIVREDAGAAGSDYGVRLMIQDIEFGGSRTTESEGGKPDPEFLVQIGKWIGKETDTNSWVSRSLNIQSDYPQPGISIYLMQSPTASTNCSSGGPTVTFAPHMEFVSLGFDVKGGANQPLFNVDGCTLRGAELRVYLTQEGSTITFGAAASLDGLGIPLGPAFGASAGGSATNQVAQSFVQSGEGSGGGAGPNAGPDAVNPSFSMSVAWVEGGAFVLQLYDAQGNPTDQVIIPIQRAFGPLMCQSIGIGWMQDVGNESNDQLSLLFNGSFNAPGLEIDLIGLSVDIPLIAPGDFSKYGLDLSGLGITAGEGPVELSATLLEEAQDPSASPPRDYTEYDGEALVKCGPYALSAVGSYAYIPENSGTGYASLFLFAMVQGDLGGPMFFFLTGVMAGFGYNRALNLPVAGDAAQFPLVAGANNPAAMGATPKPGGGWQAPSPSVALQHLLPYTPPERGQYWLAGGVKFTTYDLVHASTLMVFELGNELEIAFLGSAWLSLPPPPGPAGTVPVDKIAYAELTIEVVLIPSQGVFSATADLTPNSFVLDPACKVTGGFAFDVWFGRNPNAGQFVLTLGGYHPEFTPPDYFPKVPRLGFNWPLPGSISISGGAYFALTPSAVMTGGDLQVQFFMLGLKAWFTAEMNALVEWAPFYYDLSIGLNVGISYTIHVLFLTETLTVSVGADLELWGPKMGGKLHLSWFVISFTVSFGASKKQAPPPLQWADSDGTGFAQTLLPSQTSGNAPSPAAAAATNPNGGVTPSGILSILVNDGLLKTIDSASGTTWIVRPNHFNFTTVTAIPATEIDFAAAPGATAQTRFTPQSSCGDDSDYYVCLRPMNATLSASVLTVTLTLIDDNTVYDLAGNFDFTFSCQSVPAAKFGKPVPAGQSPEMNALLGGRMMGIQNFTPKTPVLTPSGETALNIQAATAFAYDVVDQEAPYNPNYLPLSVDATAQGPTPAASSTALATIQSTLMSAAVVSARNDVFAVLRQCGVDPMTNGTLAVLAANPGAALPGNPLLLENAS